jgi:hypothetical protein
MASFGLRVGPALAALATSCSTGQLDDSRSLLGQAPVVRRGSCSTAKLASPWAVACLAGAVRLVTQSAVTQAALPGGRPNPDMACNLPTPFGGTE